MPVPTPFTSLQTTRLTLRPFALSDVDALVPLIGTREVAATTLRIPHPYTEDHARDYVASSHQSFAKGDELRLAIVLSSSGELCGGIGLRIEAEQGRAELGYWIGVPYWGQGIATEASLALVNYGFETLRLHRVFASLVSGNIASAKVLQKIGMKHEGCQRGHNQKWGEFRDIELYGLLASDHRSRS